MDFHHSDELVKYIGKEQPLLSPSGEFKPLNLTSLYTLPDHSPSISQLVRVTANGVLEKQALVKTPVGRSYEGQHLTGEQLFLQGMIQFKMEYISNAPQQSMYLLSHHLNFCDFIVLPKPVNNPKILFSRVIVEDIYFKVFDDRHVTTNFNLLLTANTTKGGF